MLTQCSTLFWMFCSISRSVEVLAVVVTQALVEGWADKTAAVGWADVISTKEAWNWSILEDIVARAVVRVPSICLSSIIWWDCHLYS